MPVKTLALLAILVCGMRLSLAELPPVPVPDENPISEPKRVLGKILFWDEQLSSDGSIACGTCHRPEAGGADPRAGVHPGTVPGSLDDVAGSPGIRRLNRDGIPKPHPVFGDGPQVTARVAPSVFGAIWSETGFWDGRAGGRVLDPDSGAVVIAAGGALENQILETLMNPAEMANEDPSWTALTSRLTTAAPLALADRWPPDIAAAIARDPDYPALFEAAFGDASITPLRIAMAIASYERTLVPDQTPWDRYMSGDASALGEVERIGWETFQSLKCTSCHMPPLFTSNDFANIGLRRSEFDVGRERVSGDPEDAGEMKIPSLRNVGLRRRFMHTGEFASLGEAVNFYRSDSILPDTDSLPDGDRYSFSMTLLSIADIRAFLANALTDPRVANGSYPFDRPRLASER
jgi:cytochrome c peroxidase